jgi:hypothetical protein
MPLIIFSLRIDGVVEVIAGAGSHQYKEIEAKSTEPRIQFQDTLSIPRLNSPIHNDLLRTVKRQPQPRFDKELLRWMCPVCGATI